MKNKLVMTLIVLSTSFHTYSKGKIESLVYIKNGILLNSTNLRGSIDIASSPNTILQSIGYNATYAMENNLLLSSGAEIGYERYSLNIDYPFEDYGFVRPVNLDENYYRTSNIPFVQLNVNLGYRFKIRKSNLEVRLGQILHLPLKSVNLKYSSTEDPYIDFFNTNYTIDGSLGKYSTGLSGELLNFLYLGTTLSKQAGESGAISIGLQFQRKLFLVNDGFSFYDITYYDNAGFVRGHQRFLGRHNSISLLIALTL